VCVQTKHEEALPTLLAGNRRWKTTSEKDEKLSSQERRFTSTEMSNAAGFRVLSENEKIEDYFSFGTQIYYDGGQKDKVLNARRKKVETGQDCVVKVHRKRRSKVCPHLLKIQEIFEDQDVFYIVMEKCSGGELFDFLQNTTEVNMLECKRIIREILIGLHNLHSKGLIHGDVKPENIMFSDNATRNVKLIDFDTCKPWVAKGPKVQKFSGTPGYIAPEALLGEVSPQSDLWSVGVTMYILMIGYMPFDQEIKDTQVGSASSISAYEDLQKECIDWEESAWLDFPGAADLCRELLAFDPLDRTKSAAEALRHPWLQQPTLK